MAKVAYSFQTTHVVLNEMAEWLKHHSLRNLECCGFDATKINTIFFSYRL